MTDAKTIQQIADEFQKVFKQAVAESCAPLVTDCCICGETAHFYEDEFAYICDAPDCMHAAAPEYVAAEKTRGNYNGTPTLRAITRKLRDRIVEHGEQMYLDWKDAQMDEVPF